MENVKSAVEFASLSQAADFKTSILSALQDKVIDAIHLRKMEIGSKLLSDPEDHTDTTTDATEISTEEDNVDENL